MPYKQDKANLHFRRWRIQAPLGLVIIGAGACLILDAAFTKYNGASALEWISYGTIALVVFNAGISIFGGAVVHRGHYERLRD